MKHTQLFEQSKTDLDFILNALSSNTVSNNQNFSEKMNNDLEEVVVIDELSEKLEGGMKTQDIMSLSQQEMPQIKEVFPFFVTKKIKVIIKGVGDSYWIVDGKKSSIPGEKNRDNIRENHPCEYELTYRFENGKYTLISFADDNDQELGEIRTWTGRPDLMKKYRENPDILNVK